MRTRSIIKDMEAGDPKAWALAEEKLTNPRTHPENKNRLLEAMSELAEHRPASV